MVFILDLYVVCALLSISLGSVSSQGLALVLHGVHFPFSLLGHYQFLLLVHGAVVIVVPKRIISSSGTW